MPDFQVPPPLAPGSRVRLVAASSPFDRALFFRGAGFLAERYRVEIAPGTLARSGLFAGPDAARLGALQAALDDPRVDAIVAARGGYGAGRIAHRVDWSSLARSPKWIVGFSDVTALHVEALAAGVCSLHAENAAGLGRGDAHARAAWVDQLERPHLPRRHARLESWRGGRAEGTLAGGNLTVLFACHAAGRLRLPRGTILALEDVSEQSYRVDRMLSALLVARALDGVAAVAVGDFTDCPARPYGVPVEDVLRERLDELGVPVVAGLAFGHGRPNTPLCLGSPARLDASEGALEIGPGAADRAPR